MPAERHHVCKSCLQGYLKTFNGEVAIHFPGIEGLNKAIVWAFPRLDVCMNCGFTAFMVPERELHVLQDGRPIDGATVLYEKSIGRDTAGAA
jgi:hypothetical protein